MSISWMKHEIGCCLKTDLQQVVTMSGRIAFNDLLRCCLTGWSTIVSVVAQGVWPQAVTIIEIEYNRLAYSKWWSNTVRCKLLACLLSSLFFKENKKQNVELCTMATNSGLKNLQRSDTKCWGQGRQCGSKSNTLWWWRTCVWETKQDTHREREREAQRINYIPIATDTKGQHQQQQQPLQRLQGHFI